MKKLLSCLLALALCLALAAPALAADPLGDAMRAYAGIVADAAGCDFGDETGVETRSYTYALVETTDSPGIPTLLLTMDAEGYWIGEMHYTRVFRYDADSRTVTAPEEVLMSGVASAGGFRGGIGLCNGLLSTHQWASGTGMGDICTYTISGGALRSTTVWSGRIDEVPPALLFSDIAWKPVSDVTVFTEYTAAPAPVEQKPAVVLSPQKLTVDGRPVACEKYNIDGSNYFKLRDLAYLLRDTPAAFAVVWDAATGSVIIAPGLPYAPDGSELAPGADKSATAVPSPQSVWFLDAPVDDLSVYNIGGNNFFKLRDLGKLLGFAVDYDADSDTAIVRSGATAEETAHADAFDALRDWVDKNHLDEQEDIRVYEWHPETGDAGKFHLVLASMTLETGERTVLYTCAREPEGEGGDADMGWIVFERGHAVCYARYDFYPGGNTDADPGFTGEHILNPAGFSGSVPVTFNEVSGAMAGTEDAKMMPSTAARTFAAMLHWLDEFLQKTPGLGGDIFKALGFDAARLSTDGLTAA